MAKDTKEWIAIGLLLAIFCARSTKRKKARETKMNYGTEGMALGMCFGVAMGTALHIDVSLGMMARMMLGLLIGSEIEKKDNENER